MQALTLELKPLPSSLIYVLLGEEDTLPIIISNQLTEQEEEKLVHILKGHKLAIGWTIANIKGICPPTCIHPMLLEDNAKSIHESQRILNPHIIEVVKKEILKLLDVGVIYPISNSI